MKATLKILNGIFVFPFYVKTSFIWLVLGFSLFAVGNISAVFNLVKGLLCICLSNTLYFSIFILLTACYFTYAMYFTYKQFNKYNQSILNLLKGTNRIKKTLLFTYIFTECSLIPLFVLFFITSMSIDLQMIYKSFILIILIIVLFIIGYYLWNKIVYTKTKYEEQRHTFSNSFLWLSHITIYHILSTNFLLIFILKGISIGIYFLLVKFYTPDEYTIKLPIIITHGLALMHSSTNAQIISFLQQNKSLTYYLPNVQTRNTIVFLVTSTLLFIPEPAFLFITNANCINYADRFYLFVLFIGICVSGFIHASKPISYSYTLISQKIISHKAYLLIPTFALAMYNYNYLLIIFIVTIIIIQMSLKSKQYTHV